MKKMKPSIHICVCRTLNHPTKKLHCVGIAVVNAERTRCHCNLTGRCWLASKDGNNKNSPEWGKRDLRKII